MTTKRQRNVALVDVRTEQLRELLRGVFRETLPCPLHASALAAVGLQDWSEPILGHLRGLDRRAVHAVLVAVLAERTAAEEQDDEDAESG